GNFTFHLLRPTGTQTATISVAEVTGLSAGTYNQAYQLPTSTTPGSATRRIDFNAVSDPAATAVTQAGFIPYTPTKYVSTAASGLGWTPAAALSFDRGPSFTAPPSTKLLRDGHF